MKKVEKMLKEYLGMAKSAPKAIKLLAILIIPLTILTYFLNKESVFIRPYEVERGAYGKEKTPYKVSLNVGELKNMEFDFSVSSMKFTEEEVDKIFDRLYEKQIVNLLGDNEDYFHIKNDLNFKPNLDYGINMTIKFRPERLSIEENEEDESDEEKESDKNEISTISQIKATTSEIDSFRYFEKYQNIIDSQGHVHNEDLSSDEIVEGYIVIRFNTSVADKETTHKSIEYYIEANVIKKDTTLAYEIKKDLSNKIKEIDKNTLNKRTLVLPREISNRKIEYKNIVDYSFLLVPVLIIIVCVILLIKIKVDKKEEEKKILEELKIDYPQIITKILIYVSSGLTIRNSIKLIASTYEKNIKNKKRKAYEELVIAKKKLDNGMGEIKVYEEMASSLKDRTYTRFLNIIIQSIKNGNKDLKNILSLEVQDALYERKQRAKKLGEEASTKLILPLMLMLFVTMIIIMVPAFMGMK